MRREQDQTRKREAEGGGLETGGWQGGEGRGHAKTRKKESFVSLLHKNLVGV